MNKLKAITIVWYKLLITDQESEMLLFFCRDRLLTIYRDRLLSLCMDRLFSLCMDRLLSFSRMAIL